MNVGKDWDSSINKEKVLFKYIYIFNKEIYIILLINIVNQLSGSSSST